MAKKKHSTSTYTIVSHYTQQTIHINVHSTISTMSDNASQDIKPNVTKQYQNPLEDMHKVYKGEQ